MSRSPIAAMIDSVVRCVYCGATMGACDCAKVHREREIEAEYQRLMSLSDEELIAVCKELGVWPKTEKG